jgi:hypothetical protein
MPPMPMQETTMSEVNEGEQTNLWGGPSPEGSRPVPPRPRGDNESASDQTSASARALAEGWPAQPGWVPEGSAWAATPPTPAWGPQQTAPAASQDTWIPAQTPYPMAPDAYGVNQPYGGQPYGGQPYGGQPYGGQGGYPAPAPYPGPPAPQRNSNTAIIAISAVVAILVAGIVVGAVLYKRNSGTTKTAATTPPVVSAPPNTSAATGGGGTATGSQGTTGSRGTAGSSSRGGSSSTSSAPPMTSATSIDLTTVHVPAYAASPTANAVAHTLDAYFTGINSGDYSTAWSQLGSNLQAKNPLSQFEANTSGTIDHDVTVTGVDGSPANATATVTFTSSQPGDKGVNAGETCTNWSIAYSMRPGNGAGGWIISDTPSAQHSAC